MSTITSPPTTTTFTLATNSWELVDVSSGATPPNGIAAIVIAYSGTVLEQSTAARPLGSVYATVLADTVGGVGGTITVETYTAADYLRLQALTTCQRTIWISSPFGLGTYGRLGIPPTGMSSSGGSPTRVSALQPSTAAAPYHVTTLTWAAQAAP